MGTSDLKSRYLDHLPASFAVDPFIGRFLLAFERILSGVPSDSAPGTSPPSSPPAGAPPAGLPIEQVLGRIAAYFDPAPGQTTPPDTTGLPYRAPDEFLPWLAGWVATSLREDWDSETKRRFIQRVPGLYRERGTVDCLATMLRIYLNKDNAAGQLDVQVDDTSPAITEPHYFQVHFSVGGTPDALATHHRIARAIIDQEKPAHTYYGLSIAYPELQIRDDGYALAHASPPQPLVGVWVGRNTVLGTAVMPVNPNASPDPKR
jgi:phage tail-like protein